MTAIFRRLFSFILVLSILESAFGGTCWSRVTEDGFCQDYIKDGITRSECCKISIGRAGYTDIDISKSDKFLYYMFLNPLPCTSCFKEQPIAKPRKSVKQDACKGIYCGEGHECMLDSFQLPRCVCSPNCAKTYPGTVCGTNSVTYKTECDLLRSGCRENKHIKVDYYQKCQASCKHIRCPDGKKCILDQYKIPHCATMICPKKCTNSNNRAKICGTDGNTYENLCHMRRAACLSGVSIGRAYIGPCRDATCKTLVCPKKMKCVTDKNNRIRCIVCRKFCFEGQINRSVCGTNGVTYSSWCRMRMASCDSGIFVDVAHKGPC